MIISKQLSKDVFPPELIYIVWYTAIDGTYGYTYPTMILEDAKMYANNIKERKPKILAYKLKEVIQINKRVKKIKKVKQ